MARTIDLSDEERQRRSDRARALVAQGRFGGPKIGRQGVILRHERDRQRASAIAQELLLEHREKVERAFLAGLEDRSPLTRLRAAEGLVKLALGAERIGVVEHHHDEQALDRAQLLAILSAKLSQGPAAALVRRHLVEAVIDP